MENLIKTDLMDGIMWRNQRQQNKGLPELEKTGQQKLPTWPGTVKDIWTGLFKAKPEINPEANSPLQSALAEVMDTQEWKNLRAHTSLDEFGASVGTASFGKNFLENVPQEVLDAEKAAQEAISSVDALREARRMKNPELIKQMRELANARRKSAKEALGKANEACGGDIAQSVRIAGRTAATASATETEEAKDFSCAWGEGAGSFGHVPLSDQLSLANKVKNDKTLRLLAKMVGRMKRLAQGYQARKINKTPEEIVDVETGNDLKSVIPSEFLMLATGRQACKTAFYKKYHEASLLQYKKEGTEKSGKGPIMLMTDESGSMGGQRIVWAKAVGLALAWIAQKQKRDLILGGFASGGQCWTKEYPKGKVTPADVEEYAKHFYNGGTDFEMALTKSFHAIAQSKFSKKADLVFISDGDCYISDSFKREFKRQKAAAATRIFAIGVGCSEESFTDFSDAAFGFRGKLDGDEEALERIFSI